jgi:hypothetical protein
MKNIFKKILEHYRNKLKSKPKSKPKEPIKIEYYSYPEAKMIKYQRATKAKLDSFKTPKEFQDALTKELAVYGFDSKKLKKTFYNQRNKLVNLCNSINSDENSDENKRLKQMNPRQLLFEKAKTDLRLKSADYFEDYLDTTSETYTLYKQCRQLLQDYMLSLDIEIELRKIQRGFI